MQPGLSTAPWPCPPPLSSSAGVTWGPVRGSQDHLWSPHCSLGGQPTWILSPPEPREACGQTPAPVFPPLSLSELRPAGAGPRPVGHLARPGCPRSSPRGVRGNCDCGYGSSSRGSTLPRRNPTHVSQSLPPPQKEGASGQGRRPAPAPGRALGRESGWLLDFYPKPCSR